MSKSIGIDLGTTNSSCSIKTLNTQTIINAEGDALTPSVVSYKRNTKSSFIVGKPALNWLQQDPENTIVSVKRLMGRSFSDEDVQRLINEKRYSYHIDTLSSGSKNSVAVTLHDKEFTPEQISAQILEKIKGDARVSLDDNVNYAVVTVPAYFNDKQKHATRQAAALAGLKVQQLLPESTAAAISFGVDGLTQDEAKTILVFDMGGGTFDISILTIVNGQFIEQGKGGDMWMGGDDIDYLIRQFVYQETQAEYDIENIQNLIDKLNKSDKNRFIGDLQVKIEQAKIKLSTRPKAFIELPGLLKDEDGDILDIEVELEREKFEQLLQPFVDRAIDLTKQVIASIDFEVDLIDQLVMVGGSSSIPLVKQELGKLFGLEKIFVHPRPMLAISEGAAILAHRLADSYECPECGKDVRQSDTVCTHCNFDLEKNLQETGVVDIVHTSSHDYYLELANGEDQLLASSNSSLPFHCQHSFRLLDNEQQLAHFKFYNLVNDNKESIGDLWLSFDLKDDDFAIEEHEKIAVIILDFTIDTNNLITVDVKLQDRNIHISKTLSRGGIDERLYIDLQQAIEKVNLGEHSVFVCNDFETRAVKIASLINQVIDPDTGKEKKAIKNRIVKSQNIAAQLVAANESPYSNLYYAEKFLESNKYLLTIKEEKRLEKKLTSLKKYCEDGTVQQICNSRDKLIDEIDSHSLLQTICSISNTADRCHASNPNLSARFTKYVNDIRYLMTQDYTKNAKKVADLIDEIAPEVNAFNRQHTDSPAKILHGIQK